MEGYEKTEGNERHDGPGSPAKTIRAGRRTYFLDVRTTKSNFSYLTITESKKRFNKDGRYFYEKHKIYLYQEDFDKFIEGLQEITEHIKQINPEPVQKNYDTENQHVEYNEDESAVAEEFTQVEFDDLSEQ